MMVEFEWDDDKAASNLKKHGVSFPVAARVFADPNRIERRDDRHDYGEDRFVTVGLVGDVELAVLYTPRGEATRIISARKAEPHEQNDYWKDR